MKYFILNTIIILSLSVCNAQLSEGDWSENYLEGEQLNISAVRESVDILTNYWCTESEGIILVKRRKAVVRHVKHLSEKLEFHALMKTSVNDSIRVYLNELEWIKRSYLNKGMQAMQPNPSFRDKLNMLAATWSSRSKMKFRISNQNGTYDSLTTFCDTMPERPYKRFGMLADEKKIDRDKNMVVVFKELSLDGSAPKIKTWDLDFDNKWNLKWGDEVHTDVVGSRLFAALGFDVDHPYYYGKDELTLILHESGTVRNLDQLRDSILEIYNIDLSPFISEARIVDSEMIANNGKLKPFEGQVAVTFIKCAIEARPDRVKRLGSFIPNALPVASNRSLRGSLLAHVWIGNWDLREENTLLTTVHDGNYNYQVSPVFADLGSAFGVKLSPLNGDFKVGLVNEFGWEAARRKGNKVKLLSSINEWLAPYEEVSYDDLLLMAERIAMIDSRDLRKILKKSGWPKEIQTLYFHKLASRRASILDAFNINDPHPIAFDRSLNLKKNGEYVVRNGKLVIDFTNPPESFIKHKGRKRNYGN